MRFSIPAVAVGLLLAAQAAGAADYQLVVVRTEQVGNLATVGGTVIPYKEVSLAAQIPGEVRFLAGAEGDKFDKNTILARIDDEALQAQRRAAMAQIYNAQIALNNAQVQYGREVFSPRSNSPSTMPGMGVPGMFDQFFTRPMSNMAGQSDSGYERYSDLHAQGAGVGQAQGGLESAYAQLNQIDAKIRYASTTAPFDGVIVQKFVEVGDTIQPGQPLLRFAHVKYLRIRAEIPVRLVPGLRKGILVPARLDVRGAQVQARVAQIYPVADAARHTVTVKFDLPEGVPAAPGMYAEVRIPDESAGEIALPVVPEAALIWRGSLPGVFVIDPDGKPSLRLLRLGVPVGGNQVSVLSGLRGEEQVIVNPPPGLASGADAPSAAKAQPAN
jgi:multidrug efflux pump subunit AcrA (membrane-fusion protein)